PQAPAANPALRRRGPLVGLALLLGAAAAWAVVRPDRRWGGASPTALEAQGAPAPTGAPEQASPPRAEEPVALPPPEPEGVEPDLEPPPPQPVIAAPAPHAVQPAPPAEPAPAGGMLTVSSRPTGAKISQDGWERGSTPATLSIPAEGSLVEIEIEGFPPLRARCPTPSADGTLLCWDFRVQGPCRRSIMNCEPIQ
ncbi:MAG: PEGA domain-containing protein, partial [Pseudomonadota bacterium]